MSVESDIFNTLRGLVADRVFPDVAPFNTPRPYITYQQVGGEALSFVENDVPSKKHARFQISVWANTRAEASALVLQVEQAMLTASAFQARPLGAPIAAYDDDTDVRGAHQDFSVWSDR